VEIRLNNISYSLVLGQKNISKIDNAKKNNNNNSVSSGSKSSYGQHKSQASLKNKCEINDRKTTSVPPKGGMSN